jgi:hypothetical protein
MNSNDATTSQLPKFSIFVWNDNNEHLANWCSTVREAQFTAHSTDVKDVPSVVAKFEAAFPNLVLLDLLSDHEGVTLGYEIALAIRKVDPLVPIIIVTRDPSRLFGSDCRLEDLDVLAYFEATIMGRATAFREIAVRRIVNLWHQLVPDHLLARHASRCFKQCSKGSDYAEAVAGLDIEIRRLPLSGSIDIWHKKFCAKMADLLDGLALPNLKTVFNQTVKLFEIADPFYMAAGKSRRHLSHNVQVFLVGLIVLSEHEPLRHDAIESMRSLFPGKSDPELFWTAVAIWGCVALTHDTAYLSQYFSEISNALTALSTEFQPALKVNTPLQAWIWPTVHHGAVGARLWLDQVSKTKAGTLENSLAELIAGGIARHDSNITEKDLKAVDLPDNRSKVPLDKSHWIQFLAVLSDELQNWQRDRDDRPKDFRLFALDDLLMEKGERGQNILWMTFAVKDHPRRIRESEGTQGSEEVLKGFNIAKEKLERNLDSKGTLKVKLCAVIEGHDEMPNPVTIRL